MSTITNGTMSNYTEAIENLPPEAFLGSLLWFSISQADVDVNKARTDLAAVGLTFNKDMRPVDAFRKASREFARKFKKTDDDTRTEFLVRPVGEDGEQAHRFIILERARFQAGKKRQVFYEKVAEITFNRGTKKKGEYLNHSVEQRRTTMNLGSPLTTEEDEWLTERLADFEARYTHLLTHMDSHAVRTFVREFIYDLSGTCVKESGGLYFVKQEHAEVIAKLQAWVKSVGSEFHTLPLLNLADQRQMIMDAFEDETIKEVERLMAELSVILKDPSRTIEEKTFDAYGMKAAELKKKVDEYNTMLGSRADRAAIEINMYSQQVMALASRIRQTKTFKAKSV
jgi:hypothetical protein